MQGHFRVLLGLYRDYIGILQGLYRDPGNLGLPAEILDNGKEKGNYKGVGGHIGFIYGL